jgi:hypothetical protein
VHISLENQQVIRLEQMQQRLEPLKAALLNHALYQEINSLPALHLFMEHHIFAVWDFMSLLKELQRRLCCVAVPWLPSADPLATRFINEIVLAEESDEDGKGGFISHFGLYRQAMIKCRANTATIDRFLVELRQGRPIPASLEAVGAPECVCRFVKQTFAFIEEGNPCSLASAFTFGREDLLPGVFQRIVNKLNTTIGGGLNDFNYYLHRHIGMDGDEHGPMAKRLILSLCGTDETKWQTVEQAAVTALEARRDFWDGLYETMQRVS